MRNFNIKRQINKLYTLTTVSYFRIAGASWVALLALRGFSLLQIGILESIFHIASSCFEIPSGVVADVFGRKRTLALSKLVSVLSCLAMILSDNFGTVAFAIAFSALSYNLESGTIEALAYDSLKSVRQEKKYNRYASTEMMLYRITSSTATLCAGVALWLGYKKAYAIDIFFGMIALGIVCLVPAAISAAGGYPISAFSSDSFNLGRAETGSIIFSIRYKTRAGLWSFFAAEAITLRVKARILSFLLKKISCTWPVNRANRAVRSSREPKRRSRSLSSKKRTSARSRNCRAVWHRASRCGQ